MEGSSILHLKALEKLFMLHFFLFGWRPHRGQQYIAPKHMGISLLISFLFPFFSYPQFLTDALLTPTQAQTNHLGSLQYFQSPLSPIFRQLPLILMLLPPHVRHLLLLLKPFHWVAPTPEVLQHPPRDALPHQMHSHILRDPQRSSAHFLNKAPCPISYQG